MLRCKRSRFVFFVLATALIAFVLTVISSLRADARPQKDKSFKLPKGATKISDGLYYLGKKKNGLEGYAFVLPRRLPQHRPGHGGGGGGGANKTSTCYTFLARGVKWKTVEPYILDTTNADLLTATDVANAVAMSLTAWNTASPSTIFGPEVQGTVDRASIGNWVNEQNEIVFGDIETAGVIAVTIIWGRFGGPPGNRELVEWDMVLEDPDFLWGNAGPTSETSLGDTSIMDLLNIVVHETGHAAGLGHPSDTCPEESMFRFATTGETLKRTLHTGDIAGISKLYGP